MFDLISGVIVLIIGIVLWAISRALPPIANTVAFWLGVALVVIGVVIIVVALLTGALGGPYYYDWDMLSAYQPVLQKL